MASHNIDHEFIIKMIGEKDVGNTCFLLRLTDDSLNKVENHYTCVFFIDKESILLQFERIVGEEGFHSLASDNFQGVHGIILSYDITKQNSFKNLRNWLQQIKANPSTKIVLIGTKSDKINDRAISEEEGKKLADEFNIGFFECSAKLNTNIKAIRDYLVREILKGEKAINSLEAVLCAKILI